MLYAHVPTHVPTYVPCALELYTAFHVCTVVATLNQSCSISPLCEVCADMGCPHHY